MNTPAREELSQSDEPFELVRLLGSGGFAQTWLARALDPDLVEDYGVSEVALKIPLNRRKARVLQQELETNIGLYQRLKGLNCENLVRYLGFDVFRGQIVMAMEYVPDGSLRDRIGEIGRQKPQPVDLAVRIARGVLGGLMVIHQECILHRDIKPENILMEGVTPKIGDLGISRMLEPGQKASTEAGSPFYVSPEILSGEGATFTTDIWSLGVTLYELVTGQLPFGTRRTPPRELVRLICDEAHRPACEANADVPAGLSAIIDRALNKRPAERQQNAKEMLDALTYFAKKSGGELDKEISAIQRLMSCAEQSGQVEARLLQIVAKYSRDPRAYQYLGEFYNRCARYEEAVEAFRKGLGSDPQNGLLYWDLALAYQRMGERRQAVESLERALSLGLDASLKRHAQRLLDSMRGKNR